MKHSPVPRGRAAGVDAVTPEVGAAPAHARRRRPAADRLSTLPPELIRIIADAHAPGTGNGARMATASRAMHAAVGDQAKLDRLVHRLQDPAEQGASDLLQIIREAVSLPEQLRVTVLDTVTRTIGRQGDRMADYGPVLESMRAMIADLKSPSGRAKATGTMLAHFSTIGFVAMARTPAVEAFYNAIHEDLRHIRPLETASRLAAKWISGTYFLRDGRARMRQCRRVMQAAQQATAAPRSILFEALSVALGAMPPEREQQAMSFALLDRSELTSTDCRRILISTLAHASALLDDMTERNAAFMTLLRHTDPLPAAQRARIMPLLAHGLAAVAPDAQRAMLAALLARLHALVVPDNGRFLDAMIEVLPALDPATVCAPAWDGLMEAVAGMPAERQARPLARLIRALELLPEPAMRDRFRRAASVTATLPVAERAQPISALVDALPLHGDVPFQGEIPPHDERMMPAIVLVLDMIEHAPQNHVVDLCCLTDIVAGLEMTHNVTTGVGRIIATARRLTPGEHESVISDLCLTLSHLVHNGSLDSVAALLRAEMADLEPAARGRLDATFHMEIMRTAQRLAEDLPTDSDHQETCNASLATFMHLLRIMGREPASYQGAMQHALQAIADGARQARHPHAATMGSGLRHALRP